jgi:hypothetical protein
MAPAAAYYDLWVESGLMNSQRRVFQQSQDLLMTQVAAYPQSTIEAMG